MESPEARGRYYVILRHPTSSYIILECSGVCVIVMEYRRVFREVLDGGTRRIETVKEKEVRHLSERDHDTTPFFA